MFYFGAGPAQLPDSVKRHAREHIDIYPGSNVSILELSHRSAQFEQMLNDIQTKLRILLKLPEEFEILLVHGGATAQFDAVPMNLLGKNIKQKPVYLLSGFWSQRAAAVARQISDVEQIHVSPANIEMVCSQLSTRQRNQIPYIYVTPNETIDGVEYFINQSMGAPLVADMTSCLMTKEINFDPYGVIFAGTQKTLGIAGLCLVLVRKSLIQDGSSAPKWLDYALLNEYQSRVNTPQVFAIDMFALMLDWYLENGGVGGSEQLAQHRAKLIYEVIDECECYRNEVPREWRSRLNIPFYLNNQQQTDQFLQAAESQGLLGLAGHRTRGGVRASMYSPMPIAGAQQLRELMLDFSKQV